LSRAINLCESTLAFGKAEEPPPRLAQVHLAPLVADVIESETLALGDGTQVTMLTDIPPALRLRADGEQLFRVLHNLVRNARQALEASGKPGVIEVSAYEKRMDDKFGVAIRVGDTGPGLPPRARDHLFEAFQGGVRKGGIGLGLAISAELVRGHGGRLDLTRSDGDGTEFRIWLPQTE
jgi:signal transduction histidine kinase